MSQFYDRIMVLLSQLYIKQNISTGRTKTPNETHLQHSKRLNMHSGLFLLSRLRLSPFSIHNVLLWLIQWRMLEFSHSFAIKSFLNKPLANSDVILIRLAIVTVLFYKHTYADYLPNSLNPNGQKCNTNPFVHAVTNKLGLSLNKTKTYIVETAPLWRHNT